MRFVGLTGRSGSGKTTVCGCARDMGIPIMDCDAVYKELTSAPGPLNDCIAETFGADTMKDGVLDRGVLRRLVFNDPAKLRKLNDITARFMREETRQYAEALPPETRVLILDAPTLFETGMDSICDRVIGVISSDEQCIERIMSRDGLDRESAEQRLRNQPSNTFFIEHCDIVIENFSDLKALLFRAETVFAEMQTRAFFQ